jgi:hypothetical protein
MPELAPESTSPPDPLSWEDREGFRESLLLHFTRPGDADALRAFGALLYASALECAASWPSWPQSATRMELRAVALDLQHSSGVLASIGLERSASSLSPSDAKLSKYASDVARVVYRISRSIQARLDKEAAS